MQWTAFIWLHKYDILHCGARRLIQAIVLFSFGLSIRPGGGRLGYPVDATIIRDGA